MTSSNALTERLREALGRDGAIAAGSITGNEAIFVGCLEDRMRARSHSLDQVFKLSDHICVLRRGKQIGIRKAAETNKNEIVSMITGVS